MIPINYPRHVVLRLLIALSVLAAAAYFPLLGYLDLYLEEPRRALIAAQMLSSGEYWAPIHAGEIYLGKPPLFNWLIVLTSLPIGRVTEITARLPSVLGLGCLTLFLAITSYRKFGIHGAAFWGCALLLNPEFLLKGQLAEIDVVFACLVTAALWIWFIRDAAGKRGFNLWLPPLLLVSLAYLTKREPALLFFYSTVVIYLLLEKRGRELFNAGHGIALLLALLPIVGWIWILISLVGNEALWQSLLQEVLLRGEGRGVLRYVSHLISYPWAVLGANLPFALWLLPLLVPSIRHAVFMQYGPIARFASVAVLVNLPLYWFKGDVAVRYFLPMFPFLALLAALTYTTLRANPNAMRMRYGVYLSHVLSVTISGLILLLLVSMLVPAFVRDWSAPFPLWLTLSLVLIAELIAQFLRCKQNPIAASILAWMVLLMLLLRAIEFNLYIPFKALELANKQNAPAIVAAITTQLPSGQSVYVTRRIPSAVWFYAPAGLFQLLNDNTPLHTGDWRLRHAEQPVSTLINTELVWTPPQTYRYENDLLYLERAIKP